MKLRSVARLKFQVQGTVVACFQTRELVSCLEYVSDSQVVDIKRGLFFVGPSAPGFRWLDPSVILAAAQSASTQDRNCRRPGHGEDIAQGARPGRGAGPFNTPHSQASDALDGASNATTAYISKIARVRYPSASGSCDVEHAKTYPRTLSTFSYGR
jgi:hypothetical protein